MLKCLVVAYMYLLMLYNDISLVCSIEVTSDNVTEKESLLMQSEYCIVNESTVRRKSDNRDLTIVNDTGDWLVASDGNDFFILTTNGHVVKMITTILTSSFTL